MEQHSIQGIKSAILKKHTMGKLFKSGGHSGKSYLRKLEILTGGPITQ